MEGLGTGEFTSGVFMCFWSVEWSKCLPCFVTDITVICPWEAFNHLELHELAQYGIIWASAAPPCGPAPTPGHVQTICLRLCFPALKWDSNTDQLMTYNKHKNWKKREKIIQKKLSHLSLDSSILTLHLTSNCSCLGSQFSDRPALFLSASFSLLSSRLLSYLLLSCLFSLFLISSSCPSFLLFHG